MIIPDNCLWEDFRRIGPFKYPYTRYFLTKNILYINEGFFNVSNNQVSLSKISTVKLSINFIQRIFGIGTLELFTIGDSQISIRLEGIKKPEKVQNLIMDLLNL